MMLLESIINGDFNSDEVKALRDESDIICTNPPFSLFRDFLAWINPDEKKFLILGNKNAITYKEIFPLIKDNKLWVGFTPMSKDLLFDIPKDYAEYLLQNKKLGSSYRVVDGVVKGRSQSIWFTNLEHSKRNEELPLYKTYTPDEYPRYDNYDAIDVSRTVEIPYDYDGVMGVPITFLDKYNPNQFELVGMFTGGNGVGFIPGSATPIASGKYTTAPVINKQKVYARILIKNK